MRATKSGSGRRADAGEVHQREGRRRKACLRRSDAFRSAGDLGLALADRLGSEQVGVDGRADEVADRIDGVGGRLASLVPPRLSALAGNFTPLLRAESLGPCAPAFQAAQAAKRYGMGVLVWCGVVERYGHWRLVMLDRAPRPRLAVAPIPAS